MSLPAKKGKGSAVARKESAEVILSRSLVFPEAEQIRSFAIALVNPRSRNIETTVSMMKNSSYFMEKTDDYGNRVIVSEFMINEKDMRLFREIFMLVAYWETKFIFRNRHRYPLHHHFEALYQWINCYIESMRTTDKKAYCCRVSEGERSFLIPCHQVRLYAHDRLQLAHPSPLSEQFRARCIDQGFDDCPNMDYGFFTEI